MWIKAMVRTEYADKAVRGVSRGVALDVVWEKCTLTPIVLVDTDDVRPFWNKCSRRSMF